MNKQEFIEKLNKGLSGLPQKDSQERISFYSEMIDDRVEEGFTEEEAINDIGKVEDIVAQIISETPLKTIAKERIKPKRNLKTWEIVLLVLGSPIWFSLGIAALAVVFSVYITLWALIVALWSIFVAMVSCVCATIISGIVLLCGPDAVIAGAMFGLGFVFAGLSIFAFFSCGALTKVIINLTKKFALWVKGCFIKKGEV